MRKMTPSVLSREIPLWVAYAVARSVERTLAIRWEKEQSEVMRRGGSRVIFPITKRHMEDLNFALADIPTGVNSDAAAEVQVLRLLGDLPNDRAWWVAHQVARYEEFKFKLSNPSDNCEPKPKDLAALPAPVRNGHLAQSFYGHPKTRS